MFSASRRNIFMFSFFTNIRYKASREQQNLKAKINFAPSFPLLQNKWPKKWQPQEIFLVCLYKIDLCICLLSFDFFFLLHLVADIFWFKTGAIFHFIFYSWRFMAFFVNQVKFPTMQQHQGQNIVLGRHKTNIKTN